jgi:hypothetical protein
MQTDSIGATVNIDPAKTVGTVVRALEEAEDALAVAAGEARRLADALELGEHRFPRFDFPVMVEARGLATDLTGESLDTFDLGLLLRTARELRDLIALAMEGQR